MNIKHDEAGMGVNCNDCGRSDFAFLVILLGFGGAVWYHDDKPKEKNSLKKTIG